MSTLFRLMVVSIIVAWGTSCAQAADNPAKRLITLNDINSQRDVSDPHISPDGKWVAYTVSHVDVKADKDDSDIWMTSWDGKQSVRLTHTTDNDWEPRWSPDGRYLAFLSDRNSNKDEGEDADCKGDQVWLLDRRGGGAFQLTDVDGDVSDYEWSPDGKELVLSVEVGERPCSGSDKPKPIVITRLQFKDDTEGYLGKARTHLFLFNVKHRSSVQLTYGPYNELLPSWSPDGSTIAFVSKRSNPDIDRTYNWDIFLMKPVPGAPARQLTTNKGTDGDPSSGFRVHWSPNGSDIAYLRGGNPKWGYYALQQAGVISTADAKVVLPTEKLDRNTTKPMWSPDGRYIYFMLEDDQSVELARVRATGGHVERLTKPGRTVTDFDVGRRGRVAVLSSTPVQPYEVSVLDDGKLRRITHQNDAWLSDIKLAKTEAISYPSSADGTPIHAVVTLPTDYQPGHRYPTKLHLHGGPVGQHQFEFYFDWQLFAAKGYVVVAPNPRGSSGRGAEFQHVMLGKWGGLDEKDAVSAVDYLVNKGIADPDKLVVGGWSYGAILTNYVIASTHRFKAATSGAGMSDMFAGYGFDEYIKDWELELGRPWKDPDHWMRVSYPFFHADRITTPTLFMGGTKDFNVPLIGGEQMYEALRTQGIPTELVIYPGQHHEFARPSFREDVLRRYFAWYARFLK